jgi:hypothetical protein
VFFILPTFSATNFVTRTTCHFTLDDQTAESFDHYPTQDSPLASTTFEYNALVFSRTNLPNVHHKLFISATNVTVSGGAFIMFDYAIYTFVLTHLLRNLD